MTASSPPASIHDESERLLVDHELSPWPPTPVHEATEPVFPKPRAFNKLVWTARASVKRVLVVVVLLVAIVASVHAYLRYSPDLYRQWRLATEQSLARSKQTLHGYGNPGRLEQLGPDLNRTFKINEVFQHGAMADAKTPSCAWTDEHKARYAPMFPETYPLGAFPFRVNGWSPHTLPRHKLKYLFTLNLYNSSEVAPSLIKAVTEVVTLLGPSRFHVSVFENGSPDATPTQLLLFAKALEALGAGYSITSDVDRPSGYEAYKRIPALAELRNLALKPLYDAPKGTFDRVIFINDVHLCPADLFELMFEHEVQGADQSCGMDYKALRIPIFEPNYPILFYDTWVARDMNGRSFQLIDDNGSWSIPSPLLPHAPQTDQQRFHNNLPTQVFSCFNGVTVLDAALFDRIRFRSLDDSDVRSECFLLCQDIWRDKAHNKTVQEVRKERAELLRESDRDDDQTVKARQRRRRRGDGSEAANDSGPTAGREADVSLDPARGARIQVVPRASVAYFLEDYEQVRQDGNVTEWSGLQGQTLKDHRRRELIEWVDEPPESVHAYLFAKWDRRVDIPPY